MKINKMTSYAIRIVGRLYVDNDRITTSKQLAEMENISPGVVMKLMGQLKKAGIVSSGLGRGGKSGGFRLHKDIRDITLYDLILAVEESITLYPDYDKDNYEGKSRLLYDEFERIHHKYIEELQRMSLYQIINNES